MTIHTIMGTTSKPLTTLTRSLLATVLTSTLLWGTSFQQDIFQPPDVKQPGSANLVYFAQNSNQTLLCQAEGIPKPKYQWRKDGKVIVNDELMKFDPDTGVLNIPMATTREEGVFECRASNKLATSVSSPQTYKQIRIDAFTNLNSPPLKLEVNEYASASLPCRNQGTFVAPPRSAPYRWYLKETTDQLDLDNGRLFVSGDGALHYTYTRLSDNLANDNVYLCGIGDKNRGSIMMGSDTSLRVSKASPIAIKPKLLYSNDGMKALLGTNAVLECVFSGYDPTSSINLPIMQWYNAADEKIEDGGDFGKYHVTDNGRVLTVHAVTESDDRDYRCQAHNSAGYSQKKVVYLNVTSPPILYDHPKSLILTQGANAVIKCKARSLTEEDAPEEPVWSINGEEFYKVAKSNAVLSGNKETLTIKDLSKPEDILCVQCVVKNSEGQATGGACINVILPIQITASCDKCRNLSPGECSCTKWEIVRGDSIQIQFTMTTDPAYTDQLNRDWIVNGVLYSSPYLPPVMKIDDSTTGSYIMNTSDVSEEDFEKLGGKYVFKVYHHSDNTNVTVDVILKGVTTASSASSAGFDMWIIGLIIGIIFLIIIIIVIIVALVCRKKQEGVYNLGKKETTAGLDPEKDLERKLFSDLSRPENEDTSCYQFQEADLPPEGTLSRDWLTSPDSRTSEPK